MKSQTRSITSQKRKNERGAAMVMALMVSFLLLIASAGLLMESSMNTQNVTDATAEQQAYNAAESGIQSAVNVLRGNTVPNPLIDSSKPATDAANKITFVKALKPPTSNTSTDTSSAARLSRWVAYDSTCNERVDIGGATCNRNNGYGYSLAISDPDNTGNLISFSTSIIFYTPTGNFPTVTYGSGANTIGITYTTANVTDLDTTSGSGSTNFGTFVVQRVGNGAQITSYTRFELIVAMTKPYTAFRTMRGWIETNTSVSGVWQVPKIIFDAQTYTVQGSLIDLSSSGCVMQYDRVPPQHYGCESQMLEHSVGDNTINGTMSQPEPKRLLIKSTGYGPRGSKKTLEAIVRKDFFDGLSAPATLTLIGQSSTTACGTCSPAIPATNFTFNPGDSSVTVYSGDDISTTDIIPPIGTNNSSNLNDVSDSVAGNPPHPFNGSIVGTPSDVSVEVPWWLSNPQNLDNQVRALYNVANTSGRYFASGTQPSSFGDNTTATGITFCDGDCTFTGNGGGILVVTGQLTLRGNFSFNGLIIVTGKDGVVRSGGGTGTIQGNMVVAPYVGSQISDGITPDATAQFLAPQYDLSGGGNSTVQYNSASIKGGLVAVSNFVLGVVEK